MTAATAARAARVAVTGEGWSRKINGVSHEALTQETFYQLHRIMARRKIKLSHATWAALFALCLVFTETAQGVQTQRLVIGAPTGGGKTSLVIAFLAALDALGLDDVGVVVCQNRIAALIEMRRELRALGVSQERITLLHSDRQEIEEPSDGHSPQAAKQIVLMTHAAVSDRGRLRAYREWQGKTRLICWDEALWTHTPQSISLRDVVMQQAELNFRADLSHANPKLLEAHAYLQEIEAAQAEIPDDEAIIEDEDEQADEALALIDADDALQEVRAYLNGIVSVAKTAAERVQSDEGSSEVVQFDSCDDFHQLTRMAIALTSQPRTAFPALDSLLSVAQIKEVLIRVGDGGGGVISFTEAVPEDLGGILVLDASRQVRDLLHADKTLKNADDVLAVRNALRQYGLKTLSQLKTYSQVEVVQILASGGRRSIVGVKRDRKTGDLEKKQPVVLPMVVKYVVEAWDAGKGGVLVYLFKANPLDPSAVDMLKTALEGQRQGITVKTVEQADGTKTPWLHTAHHGSETGFNRARHCELVLIWGTLHENPTALHAKILAAHNDINADVSCSKRDHYAHTEKLDRLLQALSRGTLRNPGEDPGEASPMQAVVIDADPKLGIDMVKEFSGLTWTYKLGPRLHSEQERGVAFIAGLALKKFLAEQTEDKVSSRAAKAAVEAALGEKLASASWFRLRQELANSFGWQSSGSWFTR